jgi:hypothetical protein
MHRLKLVGQRERLRMHFFAPALRMSMLRHPRLRDVGMDILYDLIAIEYSLVPTALYVHERESVCVCEREREGHVGIHIAIEYGAVPTAFYERAIERERGPANANSALSHKLCLCIRAQAFGDDCDGLSGPDCDICRTTPLSFLL